MPLPGPEEIKRLLCTTLCAVKLAEPIRWEDLARELAGSSAAMVVKTSQDAAKAAVLVGGQFVTQGHLEQSVAELRKNDRLAKEN